MAVNAWSNSTTAHELAADKVNVDNVGDKTTVSLRPERIEFEPDDQMDNLVKGKIEELIYLGDHIRVRMNVAGNDEFIVKVRNRGEKRKLETGRDSPRSAGRQRLQGARRRC
jgi:putative spermidine/putrescine transport system ATP-binding protein